MACPVDGGSSWALLSDRAAALGGYGVGSPLAAESMRVLSAGVATSGGGWDGWSTAATPPREQHQGLTGQYAVEQ